MLNLFLFSLIDDTGKQKNYNLNSVLFTKVNLLKQQKLKHPRQTPCFIVETGQDENELGSEERSGQILQILALSISQRKIVSMNVSPLLPENRTCQAADELFLSVLVEEVRAKDQLQTLVARFPCTRGQHFIQQGHLLVTNATDTYQGVFYQAEDFPRRMMGQYKEIYLLFFLLIFA